MDEPSSKDIAVLKDDSGNFVLGFKKPGEPYYVFDAANQSWVMKVDPKEDEPSETCNEIILTPDCSLGAFTVVVSTTAEGEADEPVVIDESKPI